MNKHYLPTTVNIAGIDCEIYSDYRDILEIFEIFEIIVLDPQRPIAV